MAKWLISIALILIAVPSFAAEPGSKYLTLWGVSYHFDRSQGNCEFNVGVGYQQFLSKHIYMTGGVYKNSPCQVAPYAMLGYEFDLIGKNIGVGAFGGLVGGYEDDNFGTAPVLPGLPYIRIGNPDKDWHAKLIVIPASDPIFALTANYRLDQPDQVDPTSSIQLNVAPEHRYAGEQRITARWKLQF